MPIDPSIALGIKPVQIESPVNALAQLLQVQGAQQQNQLGQAKLDEYQRGATRQNLVYQTMQSLGAGASDDARVNALKSLGEFEWADKVQAGQLARTKTEADAKKALADALKTGAETLNLKLQHHRDQLGPINDPQGAAGWVAAMYADPDMASIVKASGRSLEQQLAAIPTDPKQFAQWKMQSSLGASKLVEYTTPDANTVANNATSRANNAATNATTQRGQNMTDARARELGQQGQYDAERGMLIDKRTGVAKPVTGADGKPLQAAGKMTEDQAKATGWLVQAENAWKNMKAVGLSKDGNATSAAKPGRLETVANAIPFGMGDGAANMARSADRQKFLQGASSLSEALLRAATGAGVNKEEATQKVHELTPVWGDTDENIKQKMDSIPLYIESLKVRSGPGAAKAAGVLAAPGGSHPPEIEALLEKYK